MIVTKNKNQIVGADEVKTIPRFPLEKRRILRLFQTGFQQNCFFLEGGNILLNLLTVLMQGPELKHTAVENKVHREQKRTGPKDLQRVLKKIVNGPEKPDKEPSHISILPESRPPGPVQFPQKIVRRINSTGY